jgi:hypothetical protein
MPDDFTCQGGENAATQWVKVIYSLALVARFNFTHLVETYSHSFKFAQVIFRVRLVCLIELLTINAFKVSIFYQQILQYLSKSDFN